ncbi:unnamed protein product, partial [Pelagomonas calceolata]
KHYVSEEENTSKAPRCRARFAAARSVGALRCANASAARSSSAVRRAASSSAVASTARPKARQRFTRSAAATALPEPGGSASIGTSRRRASSTTPSSSARGSASSHKAHQRTPSRSRRRVNALRPTITSVLRRAGSAFATARAVSGGASVYGASRSRLCSALRLLAFFVTALLSADICALHCCTFWWLSPRQASSASSAGPLPRV